MEYRCDLHIHSRFSFSTSKNITFQRLLAEAKLQGLNCIGTGDILHTKWYEEIMTTKIPNDIKIVPSVEICDKHNKHNLIFFESFEIRHKVYSLLKNYGNLEINGRPFINLQPFELLKILDFDGLYIGPAHVLVLIQDA